MKEVIYQYFVTENIRICIAITKHKRLAQLRYIDDSEALTTYEPIKVLNTDPDLIVDEAINIYKKLYPELFFDK